MAKNLGLSYMGSKSGIAVKLIAQLPAAETFVDLFAGGCSMTHAVILSGKYHHFIVNDISDVPQLFADAVAGKYRDEERWISREDFFRLKDSDPYVRVCWSFGNNARDYIYARTIEPYKRALHYAVFWNEFGQLADLCPEVVDACKERLSTIPDRKARRIQIGRAVVGWLKANGTMDLVESNPLYKSCHWKSRPMGKLEPARLQSLQSLERLQGLQNTPMAHLSILHQ